MSTNHHLLKGKKGEKEDESEALEPRLQGPTKVIHVVTGGLATGEETSIRGKAYTRTINVANVPRNKIKIKQPTSFTNEDLKGITYPQDDGNNRSHRECDKPTACRSSGVLVTSYSCPHLNSRIPMISYLDSQDILP